MVWVIIVLALLHWCKKKAEVFHTSDPTIKYTILQLMVLPYRFGPERFRPQQREVELLPRASQSQKTGSKNVVMSTTDIASSESRTEQ